MLYVSSRLFLFFSVIWSFWAATLGSAEAATINPFKLPAVHASGPVSFGDLVFTLPNATGPETSLRTAGFGTKGTAIAHLVLLMLYAFGTMTALPSFYKGLQRALR
ncbi:MAG: hypothetical protein AAF718_02635 [Pseudomonadota bacterium]